MGRHAVGFKDFAKWSCSAVRARLINQERRREIERISHKKAVQQSQQGRWTTWEDMVQCSISWNEIWGISPYRLAFVIGPIFDQLPPKDNLRRWGVNPGRKTANVRSAANPRHSIIYFSSSVISTKHVPNFHYGITE